MKRALPLLVVTLCLVSGCSSGGLINGFLVHRRHNINNNRAQEAYQEAITQHFQEQTLLGTWTRENALHLESHPDLIISDTRWELSLFEDGTYSVRRVGLQVGSDFFDDSSGLMIGSPMHTVAVQEGTWARARPGVIELQADKSDEADEPTTLDLSEWTNTFVEADRRLHEPED